MVSGGLACIVGAFVIARVMPAFTAWRISEHQTLDPESPP